MYLCPRLQPEGSPRTAFSSGEIASKPHCQHQSDGMDSQKSPWIYVPTHLHTTPGLTCARTQLCMCVCMCVCDEEGGCCVCSGPFIIHGLVHREKHCFELKLKHSSPSFPPHYFSRRLPVYFTYDASKARI